MKLIQEKAKQFEEHLAKAKVNELEFIEKEDAYSDDEKKIVDNNRYF